MKRILEHWQVLLLWGIAQGALAAPPPQTHTECIGYYTLSAPGGIEHAFVLPGHLCTDCSPVFLTPVERRIRSNLAVQTDPVGIKAKQPKILQARVASESDLQANAKSLNQFQKRIQDEHLDKAKWYDEDPDGAKQIDPTGKHRANFLRLAAQVPFYQPYPALQAYGLQDEGELTFIARVGEHIVMAQRPLTGSPEQTIQSFLTHYHPRKTYEIPTTPGVCLPEAFMDGETDTATIDTMIHLQDYPEIFVRLKATDASGVSDTPSDYINAHVNYGVFQTTKAVVPADKLRPLRTLTVDGYSGKGAFTQVVHENEWSPTPEAPYTDWGYIAYIPGKPEGKPGESFNLVFSVERFAKFAKAPMSEAEFRDLVLRIATSIKRRPGAWVTK